MLFVWCVVPLVSSSVTKRSGTPLQVAVLHAQIRLIDAGLLDAAASLPDFVMGTMPNPQAHL
jgi:hypothetical protein